MVMIRNHIKERATAKGLVFKNFAAKRPEGNGVKKSSMVGKHRSLVKVAYESAASGRLTMAADSKKKPGGRRAFFDA